MLEKYKNKIADFYEIDYSKYNNSTSLILNVNKILKQDILDNHLVFFIENINNVEYRDTILNTLKVLIEEEDVDKILELLTHSRNNTGSKCTLFYQGYTSDITTGKQVIDIIERIFTAEKIEYVRKGDMLTSKEVVFIDSGVDFVKATNLTQDLCAILNKSLRPVSNVLNVAFAYMFKRRGL